MNNESTTFGQKTAGIERYWDSHTLGLQYVSDETIEIGSRAFFSHIRPWMNPYKFPWIMQRIDREAVLLQGKSLLEVGCGLGYDSVEFLKRGVAVTATDLTPNATRLAKLHFELEGLFPEEVRTATVLDLPFEDESFDAVWANGVIHATGDIALALREIHRVLRRGGRAIISHFYRKPSWMYYMNLLGRENIEFTDQDPPVNEFLTEEEILEKFSDFTVIETAREHHRALPVCRRGIKAQFYRGLFAPLYNLLPENLARKFAYKFSVVAIKEPPSGQN